MESCYGLGSGRRLDPQHRYISESDFALEKPWIIDVSEDQKLSPTLSGR